MVPRQLRLFLVVLLLGLAVALWYRSLPEHSKRFYWNLARQVPDLPGRYAL